MLVIKIELWPKGDHTRARNLGTATIANTGGDFFRGDYDVVLLKSEEYSTRAGRRPEHEVCTKPKASEVWRRGEVKFFPRGKSGGLGPWDLLFRGLINLLSDRSPNAHVKVEGKSFGPSGAWELDDQ